MARKKKPSVPKTSLTGKNLKPTETNVEKSLATEEVTTTESCGLKHSNLGNYQKNNNKKQKTNKEEKTKNKIYREAPNSEVASMKDDEPTAGEATKKDANPKSNESKLSFTYTQNEKKKNKKKQQKEVEPTPVKSAEILVKPNECNTVSDLSTLQSQYNPNNNWLSLHEKVMVNNEATLNMIERYVKNDLFHKLKFISSPEMMMFSKDSRSLCQLACYWFKVENQHHSTFWGMYSRNIPKFLNKKHSDVSNGLKKQFQGKVHFQNENL